MDGFTFKKQKNISLREQITNDIRTAILKGEIPAGSRLKESDISQQMGVSRAPVREAIRQLEREGILISYPYRETVVADISLDEVKDILIPIRMHLEEFVARKYLKQIDDAFIEKLQQIINQMERSYQDANLDELVELDMLFHDTWISLAQERTVLMTWRSIQNQTKLHFIKNIRHYASDTIVQDHQALLDSLASGNLDRISEELRLHLSGAKAFQFTSDERTEME
ncbi:GntR family transcriptional regulator [Paenibacillus chungangensis]|uniref:GntR family transcriptional regulator n=1 Tax=Paenibacillus chungangensis TaxID=696535 RepID=A0ABW3HNP8_9BACL